jgi:hypothetical protein
MTEPFNHEEKGISITVLGLSLAALFYLGAQLRVAAIEKPILEAQLNTSAQRLTSTKAAQVQAEEALQKREEQIKALAEMEGKYAALLTDLIDLAKTDNDARAITQKWKIQQQGQATTTGGEVQEPKSGKPSSPTPTKSKAP